MTSEEYAQLVEQVRPKALRLARAICGEHAEDAVQGAALSFLKPSRKTGLPGIARVARMSPSYFLTRVYAHAAKQARAHGRYRARVVAVGGASDLAEFEAAASTGGCTAMEDTHFDSDHGGHG